MGFKCQILVYGNLAWFSLSILKCIVTFCTRPVFLMSKRLATFRCGYPATLAFPFYASAPHPPPPLFAWFDLGNNYLTFPGLLPKVETTGVEEADVEATTSMGLPSGRPKLEATRMEPTNENSHK